MLALLRNTFGGAGTRISATPLGTPFTEFVRGATKKAKGYSKNGRDSIGKRLGPKVADGEYVSIGNILMRQRGVRVMPGVDVAIGRDQTLYALAPGIVRFVRSKPKEQGKKSKLFIRIDPPGPERQKSIARKLARQAQQRYRGPILHPPL